MIVSAIIKRIKSQQSKITVVLPIGDANDTNIGGGKSPYILVGEDDMLSNDAETKVRVRVCYPKGYSSFLDDFVLYRLFDMFDRYYMEVTNLSGAVITHTYTSVDKRVSGIGFSADGCIFRDRIITVPCLI